MSIKYHSSHVTNIACPCLFNQNIVSALSPLMRHHDFSYIRAKILSWCRHCFAPAVGEVHEHLSLEILLQIFCRSRCLILRLDNSGVLTPLNFCIPLVCNSSDDVTPSHLTGVQEFVTLTGEQRSRYVPARTLVQRQHNSLEGRANIQRCL